MSSCAGPSPVYPSLFTMGNGKEGKFIILWKTDFKKSFLKNRQNQFDSVNRHENFFKGKF